ncbi:MAG: guanylate kinase [Myxococcales bacterium]|nr:guanylate kinase [Myxococcales bacterium]
MNLRKRHSLLIVSSPSGAGKTTLCRRLVARRPEFQLSVSHTTRPPRPGEEDGREYHFVSDAVFDSMIDTHVFLEWAPVHQHRYGTSKNEVTRIFAMDKNPLFDVDYQGTRSILNAYEKAISVFILPPSMAELARRLRARKTESEDAFRTRLGNSTRELENYGLYHHLILNDELDKAYADLEAIALGQPRSRPAPTLLDVERLIAEGSSLQKDGATLRAA